MNDAFGNNYSKQELPSSISSRLRCSQCCQTLSFDPVRIFHNNAVLCARCDPLNPYQAVRSFAFENAAKYFLYNCKNDHCHRLLEREDVQQHEIECVYGQRGCCACWKRCLASNPQPQRKSEMYYVLADDAIHELITCAYCYGYASSKPIYIQLNGEHICYRCGPDLQVPPIIRDQPLEILLECFIINCSYRTHGCTERFKFGEECNIHEEICAYNPRHQTTTVTAEAGGSQKMKGVIATISSGHIYATITPHHFKPKYGHVQELETHLPDVHREEHQHNEGSIDRFRNVLYNNVVSEIKFKQTEKGEPSRDY